MSAADPRPSLNAAEAAREYLQRGFAPIPIPRGKKGPIIEDWSHFTVTEAQVEDHFQDTNIGLVLGSRSGGLTDVDLDAPEALSLAPRFLPQTGMIHGRRSNPDSHRWYRLDEAVRTRRFQDTDGTCLLEVRGAGHQTVAPPSVHPSGEAIEWTAYDDPATVSYDALLEAASLTAAASLLVRHYPKPGTRQDLAMALAGALLRGGRSEVITREFILAVAETAQDEEANKRGEVVASTAEALKRGGPVTGLPRVCEILGSEVGRRLGKWLGLTREAANTRAKPTNQGAAQGPGNKFEMLLELTEHLELFHSCDDDAFVTIESMSGPEPTPINSDAFRDWIATNAWETLGFYPRKQLIDELIHQKTAEAKHRGPKHDIHIRVAGDAQRILIDLADEHRQLIEVSSDDWHVLKGNTTRFFRPSGMESLPVPQRGAGIEYFSEFFNYASADDLRLLLAWMAYTWTPNGPYPLLILQGEAGSAKSTLAHMIKRILDPSSLPLRAFPRDERDFAIAARTNRILCFDNLSGIKERDSDMLCRIATGAGFATRRLYSDYEEVRFQLCRPVILNGIDDLATRPDLIDRAVILNLPAIAPEQRQNADTLWRNFDLALPHMIGTLLSILAEAMRHYQTVTLGESPRMADFARWATAAEQALGWSPGGFLTALRVNQHEALEVGVESSAVTTAVASFLTSRGKWTGTATDLLNCLNAQNTAHIRSRSWPQNATQLGNQLRRGATALRTRGFTVEFQKTTDHQRTRLIHLAAPPHAATHPKPGASAENTVRQRPTRTPSDASDAECAIPPRHSRGFVQALKQWYRRTSRPRATRNTFFKRPER